MAHLESKGHALPGSGTVIWIVERHRFEFTADEFKEMINGIQRQGLFAYLDFERPALKSQLLGIGRNLPHLDGMDAPEQSTEIEFLFEQALLNLNVRLQ